MTTTENIPPDDVVEALEATDAGAEGHDVPPELLELHGLIELANNGGPA